MAIIPVAKTVYLCEEVDVESGATNMYALFNAIRPPAYPHTQGSFCAFAQLTGGSGELAFYIDIRRAADERTIHTSAVRPLRFERRGQLLQVYMNFEHIRFPTPGVYLVEMYCNNAWVADVTLELLEDET